MPKRRALFTFCARQGSAASFSVAFRLCTWYDVSIKHSLGGSGMNKRLSDDLQISAIFSAVFGFAIYLIMLRLNPALWWMCFVAGGGLFVLLALYLVGYDRLVIKRYAAAIAATGAEVAMQTQGNFLTEYGKRTGNIYFCNDRIYLISLNKRPRLTIEIKAEDAVSFTMPRTVELNIQMKDGSQKTIHSVDVGALGAMMKKKKWGKK